MRLHIQLFQYFRQPVYDYKCCHYKTSNLGETELLIYQGELDTQSFVTNTDASLIYPTEN